MFTWQRFLIASCITLLLALLFITLILPGIVSHRARSWVAAETGRTLEIESISINPFSLSVEIRQLQLSDTNRSNPFVSWNLLKASLSISSLYHLAPIVDELRLESPYIHLERLTADTFNFSDLLPARDEELTAGSTDEPTRFSINNVSVHDGQVDLVDSSLEEPVHHTIRDLQLALPAIGTLPYMVDNPVEPLFRAVINHAEIDIEGKGRPFSSTREMQFDLVLDNIDLPFYLAYVPIDLPVELRNGRLSVDLDILYSISAENGGDLALSGSVNLASLDIWDRQQEKLFFLPLLQVEIASSRPLQQQLHLSAVRAYNLEVQLKRDQKGAWNHSRMASGETGQPPSGEEETSHLKLQIDAIEIRDGVIFFEDNLPAAGFNTVARNINIDANDFSLDAKKGIPLKLSLETDRDEVVSILGEFMLDPFSLELRTEFKNLHVGAYEPYYHDIYSGPLGGRLDLQAGLSINPEESLLISNGGVKWQQAYMAFNEQEGIGADQVSISGIFFNLDENRLQVDSASYEDGRVNFSRDQAGHWSFLSRNFPLLAKLTETPGESPPVKDAAVGPAFSYHIGEFAIKNWSFKVRDNLPETPANWEASNFNLTFNNLAAPEKVESPFTFSTTFQQRGKISVNGTASLANQSVSMKTDLSRIPLSGFAPYIADRMNLILADGYLDARLRSSINAGSKQLQATYGGDIGISRFHLLDSLYREDLLKWDSLLLSAISGQLEPSSLKIGSITLSDYFAKVLIDEHARLNLKEALRSKATQTADIEEGNVATPGDGSKTGPDEEQTVSTPEIVIDTITLQGGRVDFTDRNLPRPFHADMRELGGSVQHLSSDPATRAEVDLRGHLSNQSPLVITGSLNPLAEKLFLDLKLSFNDIELSPLSSYSGTYAGYLIEKGKLHLALEYYIEDDQLKASNEVFLDQFSFGESVESEKATSLPVKLAVALLKDRNGEIHLDIPVSGSIDDPQFSVTGVVWTVIKNLLVKAATSPFALLGALIGAGEEDFSDISFEYGSARLETAEQEKLLKVSQALQERPGLDVEVSGFSDPDNDVEGLRREQLSMATRHLKYLELVEAGQLPEGTQEEDVVIPAEEYGDYLWQVYREADFPKPRSFIGMTKKLPVAEMEKLIYTNTPVTDEQLSSLAQARARAVQNFLVEKGLLASKRIFLTKPDQKTQADQESVSQARVGLSVQVR